MATTSGSETSSLAPTDFRLCTSLDESNGVISVAVEHCQLCGGTRRLFYCKDCVHRGEFVHSRSNQSDRYADKMQRWYNLKKEKLKLLERIEKALSKSRTAETKKYHVQYAEERVQLLRKAVASAHDDLKQEKDEYEKMTKRNIHRREKCKRFGDKRACILRFLSQSHETKLLDQQALEDRKEMLYRLRRQHVKDLGTFIFPISEIQPKSDADSMVMSTVSALAEARCTRFIRGRWVYTDNGGEHQYRIVEPTLPGNGDYSSYNIWLSENRDDVPSNETELGQRNPAYTLSAALTYTAQLVSLLAYFLDVNLPKRLCYSEFCGLEKSEFQFQRAVSRLNHNILHLCFTQNINPELLHPRHTIHNLVVLLKSTLLGRGGSFEVNPELMQSLDESNQSESSDIDVTSSEDDLDCGDPDWERVPVTLPEDVPCRSADSSTSSRPSDPRPASAGPASSMAGGIISSVASFWRAATSTRTDK